MKSHVVLAIETSGGSCRVARVVVSGNPKSPAEAMKGAKTTEKEYSGDASRHSEMLWKLLDGVLSVPRTGKGRGNPLHGIDLVAVSIGPGSFTGLRVGLAAAKVFARFGGLPLAGVPTLDAAAEEGAIRTQARTVLVALDAKRGEVYAARYRRTGMTLRKTGAVRVRLLDEARAGLPGDAVVLTDTPGAGIIGILGLVRFLKGKRDDPDSLVPLYIRRPEAVERRFALHRRRK